MKKEFHLMKTTNILLMCFFLTGCVTLNSVKKELNEVNYSDGVNQKEAIAIARMSMINSKLHSNYHLWTASIYDNGSGYWRVVFLSLHFNRHACVLIVEKDTGDILAFFEAANDEEAAIGANPVYSIEDWQRVERDRR